VMALDFLRIYVDISCNTSKNLILCHKMHHIVHFMGTAMLISQVFWLMHVPRGKTSNNIITIMIATLLSKYWVLYGKWILNVLSYSPQTIQMYIPNVKSLELVHHCLTQYISKQRYSFINCWLDDLFTRWPFDPMTYLLDDSMTWWLDDLLTRWPVDSMTCLLDDLLTRWPVDSMTCWLNDLFTWWHGHASMGCGDIMHVSISLNGEISHVDTPTPQPRYAAQTMARQL
jgi:hypothetical protein